MSVYFIAQHRSSVEKNQLKCASSSENPQNHHNDCCCPEMTLTRVTWPYGLQFAWQAARVFFLSQMASSMGVLWDSRFDMNVHVGQVCRTAYCHISNISALRRMLTREVVEILVHAKFVSSRLDYCNWLFYGLPDTSINKLQRVQNAAAAHVIMGTGKRNHITLVLYQSPWLTNTSEDQLQSTHPDVPGHTRSWCRVPAGPHQAIQPGTWPTLEWQQPVQRATEWIPEFWWPQFCVCCAVTMEQPPSYDSWCRHATVF